MSLLVSADTPGALMRDDPRRFPVGHIVAHALEDFSGSGVSDPGVAGGRQRINVLFERFVRPPLPQAAAPPGGAGTGADPSPTTMRFERLDLEPSTQHELERLRDEVEALRRQLSAIEARLVEAMRGVE